MIMAFIFAFCWEISRIAIGIIYKKNCMADFDGSLDFFKTFSSSNTDKYRNVGGVSGETLVCRHSC